jgi:hypothetical protein
VISTDSNVRKHEYDMIIDLFQPPKDDLLKNYHDDFWSYLGGFNTYYFEHLDLFYEEYFQPLVCSNFDEGKDMIGIEHDLCDESFHPSPFSLAIDRVGIFSYDSHFPMRRSCFQPMVYCNLFYFHTQYQQTLGCGN